ncbi:MAG: hypothetical protein LBO09_07885 [Candidatus Peribacteria bacterium]|jgi:hypothetical protein|nr:hypothetical protein [Candidatus Peribacteria bacterium]
MKKILKKIPLRKKEHERTKGEKIARNLAFFGVVIFTAIMAYALVDAEASLVEAETNLVAVNYQ